MYTFQHKSCKSKSQNEEKKIFSPFYYVLFTIYHYYCYFYHAVHSTIKFIEHLKCRPLKATLTIQKKEELKKSRKRGISHDAFEHKFDGWCGRQIKKV